MKYAHPSCNEYVQPQMEMSNMTMYRDTILTNKNRLVDKNKDD